MTTQHDTDTEHDPASCPACIARLDDRRRMVESMLRWRLHGQADADDVGAAQIGVILESLAALSTEHARTAEIARMHGHALIAQRHEELAMLVEDAHNVLLLLRDRDSLELRFEPLTFTTPADSTTVTASVEAPDEDDTDPEKRA